MYHNLFDQSPMVRHLDSFQSFTIICNPAMNIFMHILVIAMIIFSGNMLRLWNNSLNIFKALNIWLQITLQEACSKVHSLQQCVHKTDVLYLRGDGGSSLVIPA